MCAYIADAIANTFLDLSRSEALPISHMKLQKLVYFAHGWCLAFRDEPLIQEMIQAWKYGPVVLSLYQEFKSFGSQNITRKAAEVTSDGTNLYEPDVPQNDIYTHKLVNEIWRVYKVYNPIQLSSMTHAEGTPWHIIASKFLPEDIPPGLHIPDELIRQHFKSLLSGQQNHAEHH